MPRIINLNQRVKNRKKVTKSPHVLDLKKEMEKRAAQKELESQSEPQKILHSAGEQVQLFKTKINTKLNQCKQKVNRAKDRIRDFKLKLQSFKPKFEPDVSRLSLIKKTKAKSTALIKKIEKKERVSLIERFFIFFAVRKTQKQENKITDTMIATESSSSIITPFYIFRLKNSLANIFLFLLFVGVLILPIKGFSYVQRLTIKKDTILDHATAAASYLEQVKEAGLNADLESAGEQFSLAAAEFILAQNEVEEINKFTQVLIKIIPRLGGSFKAGEDVLILGEYLAKAGQYLAEIGAVLQDDIAGAQFPTVKLEIIKDNLNLTLWQLQKAAGISSEIKIDNIPVEYQAEIAKAQQYLPQVTQKTEKLLHYIKVIQQILGHDELKRYLLVFQNNNELRATGGFLGSFALVDFNQGKIENIEIPAGGSYDLEGAEMENIIAPSALQLINPHWHFWDANWFFDFPTSAEKLIEFYNSSGGPTVDGVIAINANLMQELVGAIGPVEIEGYDCELNEGDVDAANPPPTPSAGGGSQEEGSADQSGQIEVSSSGGDLGEGLVDEDVETEASCSSTLTGENFIKILQEEGRERKFAKEPKRLLSLAGPEIIKRLTGQPESWLKILPILKQGLKQKDLQFYFISYDLEREVMDLGWSGRILETAKDYLAVVHTNLGGGKTDQVIKDEIWHSAEILENGEVIDTLIITRQHQGQKDDPFVGIANNDYLRVYVPLGSKLISAHGFSKMPAEAFETPEEGYRKDELIAEIESQTQIDRLSGTQIFTESNKTVFANWLHLEPGETKSVYLKYRLPFVISKKSTSKEKYTLWEQISLTVNPKLQSEILPLSSELNYYSLLIQKQSGTSDTNFISKLKLPADYKAIWNYPDSWQAQGGVYQLTAVLNQDMIEAIVVE